MLRNYLTIAYRNLKRQKGYAAINVAGLAIGLAVCFVIGLYVRHELSYDDFHEKADRIYRVAMTRQHEGETTRNATAPNPLAAALNELPEVQEIVKVSMGGAELVRYEDKKFYEQSGGSATANVFDVFDFSLKQGNPQTALQRPFTVVITPTMARKYFGSEDPIGKVLTIDQRDYEVTGILAPMPDNTRFQADYFTSWATQRAIFGRFIDNWNTSSPTYLLLPEDYDPERLEKKFPALVRAHQPEKEAASFSFALQPLPEIYLHHNMAGSDGPHGDPNTLYLLGTIALLILLIACVNYMNLATARSAQRAREVGMRKVVGAHRGQLVRQFLGESVLISFLALPFALLLATLLVPVFNTLVGSELTVGYLSSGPFLLTLTGMAVLVGIVAGSYPAFVLSGSDPVAILWGGNTGPGRHALLRKGLVVSQFAIAIALIVSAGTVRDQLNYLHEKKLGFSEEHVISIPLRDTRITPTRYASLKNMLLRHTGIEGVTASSGLIGTGTWDAPFTPDDNQGAAPVPIRYLGVDHDFIETLGINVVAGRSFSKQFGSDASNAFILNEAAVRALGWDEPIGKKFKLRDQREGNVVGVVEDFHYASLRTRIQPMALYIPEMPFLSRLYVQARPGNAAATLDLVRDTWDKFFPDWPLEYAFLDDKLNALYQSEEQLSRIFGYFAGLAILIACLGLFGLAAYTAERRTKEIGIRKVFGASVTDIVTLLSKDFAALVLVAVVIAVPVAYYAMSQWLQDFAYRIELSPWIFVAAGTGALVIALATVSYQAVKAALADPVDAIRYE